MLAATNADSGGSLESFALSLNAISVELPASALLQPAAPGCFDTVVAYAPTSLNMTEGCAWFTAGLKACSTLETSKWQLAMAMSKWQ
jgi:hypothetical protein